MADLLGKLAYKAAGMAAGCTSPTAGTRAPKPAPAAATSKPTLGLDERAYRCDSSGSSSTGPQRRHDLAAPVPDPGSPPMPAAA